MGFLKQTIFILGTFLLHFAPRPSNTPRSTAENFFFSSVAANPEPGGSTKYGHRESTHNANFVVGPFLGHPAGNRRTDIEKEKIMQKGKANAKAVGTNMRLRTGLGSRLKVVNTGKHQLVRWDLRIDALYVCSP